MRINDDLTVPEIILASELPWVSPVAGVDRQPRRFGARWK